MALKNGAIFVNMATGYLFFTPIVFILIFLGMGQLLSTKKVDHRLQFHQVD